jgi:glycosyltransferase involved in cell wall biosynthesis
MSAPDRVLFLGHAAERTGPPLILLELLRWIRAHTELEPGVVLIEGGPLLEEYRAVAPTWILQDWLAPGPAQLAWRVLHRLRLPGMAERVKQRHLQRPVRDLGHWSTVYANCAGTARLLPLLPSPPDHLVAHIHELSTGLDYHLPPETRELLFDRVDRIIAVSDAVTQTLLAEGLARPDQITCIHGCIDPDPPSGPTLTRADLGIADDAFLVGSAGLRHWRKAPDLFVSVARRVIDTAPDARFVWLGGDDDAPASRAALADVERAGLTGRVEFVAHQDHPRDWFRLFDAFLLTAREDAYPLVCLEAASVGVPIVCFTSGGAPEFVRADAGVVVPYPDLDAAAAALLELRADPDRRRALGETGRARARAEHAVSVIAPRLVEEILAVTAP